MTDEQIEQERQAFEQTMSQLPYEFEMERLEQRYRRGEYRHYHVQCAWEAWLIRAERGAA